ncbi:MAG: hypothetical protein PVSMB7_27140 [Chloroflexota bacterium]
MPTRQIPVPSTDGEPLPAGSALPDASAPGKVEKRRGVSPATDRTFYVACKQADGTYTVTLTEDGVQRFETALAIADDLGRESRISPRSTIADIMDRTATREELSELLRREERPMNVTVRVAVLKRRLRGSERVTPARLLASHIAQLLILGVLALWAIMQPLPSIQDIQDIPGILAGIPNDVLNLHPTSAFGEVGNRISDAGLHVLYGVVGVCLAYLLAFLIHPLAAIYLKDQLLPGERRVLRMEDWALRRRSGSHGIDDALT